MQNNKVIKQNFEKLGKRIQKLREEKNISLIEMSCKTGIRKEYLQKIEKGTAYGILIGRHLIKIANAFEINIYDLFQYE